MILDVDVSERKRVEELVKFLLSCREGLSPNGKVMLVIEITRALKDDIQLAKDKSKGKA